MSKIEDFLQLSPTNLADSLTRAQVMNLAIRPLWPGMPRIAGPAYTVRCAHGDNLMLHAAIYRAPSGSVIVVESGDTDYAAAGGNVCAVAQQRGIAGFVIDGVIRDLAEVRELRFPVFARGLSPIPGRKEAIFDLNIPIQCGSVAVAPGDIVVADEEGIVVVPQAAMEHTLNAAQDQGRAWRGGSSSQAATASICSVGSCSSALSISATVLIAGIISLARHSGNSDVASQKPEFRQN